MLRRLTPAFRAAPVNAQSNHACVATALWTATSARRQGVTHPVAWLLSVMAALVGAGSLLFDIFATRWARALAHCTRTGVALAGEAHSAPAKKAARYPGRPPACALAAAAQATDQGSSIWRKMAARRDGGVSQENNALGRPTRRSGAIGKIGENPDLSNRSGMSRHAAPGHKAVARSVGFALTLGDELAWSTLSLTLYRKLTLQERAALAFACLRSMDEAEAIMTAEAAIWDYVPGVPA